MKEKLKDKKVVYTIIGIISLLLVVIAVTYAYWLVTRSQTNTNTITSACLDISLSNEANDITLTNQFPMSDEDGMTLTPYTFTVTNNCNTSVDYQIALEAIGDESTAIASSALKVALDEEATLLSDKIEVETTVSGAYRANRLGYGTLTPSGSEGSSDTHSLRLWIDEDAPISEMNKTFNSKISITIGQEIEVPQSTALSSLILADAQNNNYLYSTTPDFSTVTIDGEYGLYSTQDDYGTSYYFRGDIENNYVKFGKWQEDVIFYYGEGISNYGPYTSYEQCVDDINNGAPFSFCTEYNFGSKDDDMYWRIVRINGDGSIRLIYDGTSAVANSNNHIAIVNLNYYNSNDSDAQYVGYTYDDGSGNQVDSTIKGVVDEWYIDNLEQDYGKYIADSIFCNDREGELVDMQGWYATKYASYTRLYTNKNPKLTCTNQSDRYTVDDTTKGNGLLTKPVGLITADEISMAGGVYNTSGVITYLKSFNSYWTMSPSRSANIPSMWYGSGDGSLYDIEVNNAGGLGTRPVINLKADVEFSGNGTIDSPYEIVIE